MKTYDIIKDITDKVYDWETHLPRLLEKDALKQILDAYYDGAEDCKIGLMFPKKCIRLF